DTSQPASWLAEVELAPAAHRPRQIGIEQPRRAAVKGSAETVEIEQVDQERVERIHPEAGRGGGAAPWRAARHQQAPSLRHAIERPKRNGIGDKDRRVQMTAR